MALGALIGENLIVARNSIGLSLAVCSDPDPGPAGPTLVQIRSLLSVAIGTLNTREESREFGAPLLHLASVLAATADAGE
jgi:hypothetical protein